MTKITSRPPLVDLNSEVMNTLRDMHLLLHSWVHPHTTYQPTENVIELVKAIYKGLDDFSLLCQTYKLKSDLAEHANVHLRLEIAAQDADLKKAAKILEGLCNPPDDDKIIEAATNLLCSEGQAEYSVDINTMTTVVKFDSSELSEAMRSAVMYYNLELANKILSTP